MRTKKARHADGIFSSDTAELVYGINNQGKVVHVSTVISGAACHCNCPGCDAPLVARHYSNGTTDHFAHMPGASCSGAAETALHRMAKQIVEESRELLLPDVTAKYKEEIALIHKSRLVKFDTIKQEYIGFTDFVPDLFLDLNGHSLIVEIYVTHACDEEKIEKLRMAGIAALEIDISDVNRAYKPEFLRDVVLETAKRKWIFHPKIDAEVERLKEVEIEELRKKQLAAIVALERNKRAAEAYIEDYEAGVIAISGQPKAISEELKSVRELHLSKYVGIQTAGAGCFNIPLQSWQAIVINLLIIDNMNSPFGIKQILEFLRNRSLIRQKFLKYIEPDQELFITSLCPDFATPFSAIRAYLDVLRGMGLIFANKLEYRLTYDSSERIRAIRANVEKQRERLDCISTRLSNVKNLFDQEQRANWRFEYWLKLTHPSFGLSYNSLIKSDNYYTEIEKALRRIERMLFEKGEIADDLLGLPLASERGRQERNRAEEAVDAQKKRERDQIEAKMIRIEEITRLAISGLAAEGKEWLSEANSAMACNTPLDFSAASPAGLWTAKIELDRHIEAKRERRRRENFLTKKMEKEFADLDVGQIGLFISTQFAELGGKTPGDYCNGDIDFKRCAAIARRMFFGEI